MNLTLTEIIEHLNLSWVGEEIPSTPIRRICIDSRQIQAGDLFIALKGEQFDGHAFVEQALSQGAIAALVSSAWQKNNPQNSLIVADNTLASLQNIAKYYRGKFSVQRIALTGSAGKTTCKEFLYSVLLQKFNVHRNIKSFNNHIGVPLTLLGLNDEHDILITELGTNHFGEIDLLSSLVEQDFSILLNIGYAHLEYFKDRHGVAQAKMEIINHAQHNGRVFFNADDDLLIAQDYKDLQTITFAIDNNANVHAENLHCDHHGCYSFELQATRIQLAIPGRHNVYNALAAAAVGMELGLSIDDIQAGLEGLSLVDRRMDVHEQSGLVVMNDVYNANPGSCRAALATGADIQLTKDARRIAVLADMLELGDASRDEHEKLASTVQAYGFDMLFLFGNETKITAQAAEKISLPVQHFRNKEALINELKAFLQPGDLVLVKGSRSMQMEQVVNAL